MDYLPKIFLREYRSQLTADQTDYFIYTRWSSSCSKTHDSHALIAFDGKPLEQGVRGFTVYYLKLYYS